jgi:ABC-type oligopeptide transport system substrate-binding subunit
MHSKGAFNHVKIPELDAFLDAAAEALDPNVIKHKLAEAMHYIRNHHLAVPVLEFDQAFAVTNKLDKWKPVFLPQDLNFDTMFKR